jgi:hypothetical protein
MIQRGVAPQMPQMPASPPAGPAPTSPTAPALTVAGHQLQPQHGLVQPQHLVQRAQAAGLPLALPLQFCGRGGGRAACAEGWAAGRGDGTRRNALRVLAGVPRRSSLSACPPPTAHPAPPPPRCAYPPPAPRAAAAAAAAASRAHRPASPTCRAARRARLCPGTCLRAGRGAHGCWGPGRGVAGARGSQLATGSRRG